MERPFDVFLSHNSRDKPVVRQVCEKLREHGVWPWLDAEELIPGRDWQKALESILKTVPAAAVFLGSSGLGPWESGKCERARLGGEIVTKAIRQLSEETGQPAKDEAVRTTLADLAACSMIDHADGAFDMPHGKVGEQ